jgi:hypothetical protein
MNEKENFCGELAKNLPIKAIYDDLAHPVLSTVGQTLQGVTKIALAPITGMVWGYDKIAAYLDTAIPEYFAKHKIPKEKIKTPDPSIAVPIIGAMTYTSHKTELKSMFTNLLGASMNEDVVDEHPAFVEIIKQLCTDECKILDVLYKEQKMPMLKPRLNMGEKGEFDVVPFFSDIGYLANCKFPDKFPEYLDNLHRLGLVDVILNRYFVDESVYEKLRLHPNYKNIPLEEGQTVVEQKSIFELSELGKKFCNLCLD